MDTTTRNRYRPVAIGAAISTTAFAIIATSIPPVAPTAGSDDTFYFQLAETWQRTGLPFTFRVFTPTMVRLLPFPTAWSFFVWSSLMLGVTAALLDMFLRPVAGSRGAYLGVALFAVSGIVHVLLVEPCLTDATTFAFFAAVFLALQHRSWWWVCALMPLAVLNHETSLVLLIPIVFTTGRAKEWGKATIAVAAALAVYYATHSTALLFGETLESAPMIDTRRWEAMVSWNAAGYGSLLAAVWGAFAGSLGVAWLLAPLGWRRAPQLVRDGVWMVVPLVASWLLAGDWYRLIGLAFVPVIALAAVGLSDHDGEHVGGGATEHREHSVR